MADEMGSIPPRVGSLEMEVHTVKHRLTVLEETHREIPHRMTKVEMVLDRLPDLERKIGEQGDMIRKGFMLTHGFFMGVAAIWFIFQAGPAILKFLGG